MGTKPHRKLGTIVYILLTVIIVVGYGWFVISTSGRDDIPSALRYLIAICFVTFGGIAGTGAYMRIRERKKRRE
jgi:hypothetical protein